MQNYLPLLGARHNGRVTDRSGTIATGGTQQNVMPANAKRAYLFIQNVSSGDLWIDLTVPAVSASPSIRLPAGAVYSCESGFIPTDAINIIGATLGQAYSAKEA